MDLAGAPFNDRLKRTLINIISYRSLSPQHPLIMHRFWEIDEMLRLLAMYLDKQHGASASAVALACCSKRLGDVVLDSLWEELRCLSQLMQCLPPDTWEIYDGEFVSTARSDTLALGAYLSTDLHALPHR